MFKKLKISPRKWDKKLKRRVVAAMLQPGASMSSVSKKYKVSKHLLSKWKKTYASEVSFVPVSIAKSLNQSSEVLQEPRCHIKLTLSNGNIMQLSSDYVLEDVRFLVREILL